MFHPDKPVYKDSFGASPFGKDAPELYLHISPNGNMIGGGIYRPDNDALKKIREAIDYDGQELVDIISKKSFTDYYDGLMEDDTALKTSPRGYNVDHEFIELLRRKSFAAVRTPTQKEVLSSDYIDMVEQGYLELSPLNRWLTKAITFEA